MDDQQSDAPDRVRGPGELGPRGRRTRERLLAAGRRVIAEKGYHGTRVDDIAALAGTSHGTFYLYFTNVEHLLEVLLEESDAAISALTDELPRLAAGEDGRDAFRAWVGQFDALYLEHGAVLRAHVESNRATGGKAFEVYAGLQERLADAIEEAGCEVAAEVAAMGIIAMLERFAFYSPPGAGDERDASLDTLAALSHAGLFG